MRGRSWKVGTTERDRTRKVYMHPRDPFYQRRYAERRRRTGTFRRGWPTSRRPSQTRWTR